MTKSLVPTIKVGTPFQSPSWRYQAVYFPEKFGFSAFCSKHTVDAGHLSRMIPKGVRPVATYNLPLYFQRISSELPAELSEILLKTWNKYYFNNHRRKLTFGSASIIPISWKVDEVKQLNDEFLSKLILHCFNYEYDSDIEEAVKFYKDADNFENKSWFRYAVYSGYTDADLAKKWQRSLGFVRALRLAFFDYSHWPKDRLTQFSLIRTLQNTGEIDESGFHIHKRIYDLGDVGLRSIFDFNRLSEHEKKEVEMYLSACPANELLNLKYCIKTSKDAHAFHKAVAEYANIGLKRLEIEQKAEFLRLSTTKLAKEMGMNEETKVYNEDTVLINELEEMKKFDHVPNFPSFVDVRKDQNLIVEKST